jgi:hypothetical protein
MKNVLIGIPAYDSKVFVYGMAAIFANIERLKRAGHDVTFTFQIKGAYIDHNRNKIVKEFLDGPYTDLVFVDADLWFDHDAIEKLLKPNVEVIGGAYPYRELDDKGYPVEIKLDKNKFPVADLKNGLIECEHLPTGLLRIQRSAIKKLAMKYPHMVDANGMLQLFRTGQTDMYEAAVSRLCEEVRRLRDPQPMSEQKADPDNPYEGLDSRYFGEDVYFCKMCNRSGIKVWCDPSIKFVHYGTLPKSGCYAEFLSKGGVC